MILQKGPPLLAYCKYECYECKHQWGEWAPGAVICPKCHHIYVHWLNYWEVLHQIDPQNYPLKKK